MKQKTPRILIVEDESLIAYTLEKMLNEIGISKIDICHKMMDAKYHIQKKDYELVLLDIHLGKGGEGLEIAKLCFSKDLRFIFLTSYSDEKTIGKALEMKPESYLVKPILTPNLHAAVKIALGKELDSTEEENFIFKCGHEIIKLKHSHIIHIAADNIYLNIETTSKNYLIRKSLKSVQSLLPSNFVQTHRSHLVNLDFVDKIEANSIIIQDKTIPLSRSYKQYFKELVDI